MNKLSILICTLPERIPQFNNIIRLLNVGTREDVEVIADGRDRFVSTGQKRNDLIAQSTGTHFCFVDDDDEVMNDYTNELAKAIQSDPDVVTFKGRMTTNGGSNVDWVIRLGEKYEARQDADGITRYYRFPNHLCVFKKERVFHVKFPHTWHGEDYEWAKAIHDRGLLKTEVHIDKQLYHYQFSTRK